MPCPAPSPGYSTGAWFELLGHKTIGTLLLGRHIPYQHSAIVFILAGGLLASLAVWRLFRVGALGTRFALPAILFGLAATALAFLKFRYAADLLVPPAAAVRYFYLLWVITCWVLITLVLKDRPWAAISAALLLIAFLHSSFITVFRTPPPRNLHWQSYEARLEAGEHLWIPIHPKGWRIKVNEPAEPSIP